MIEYTVKIYEAANRKRPFETWFNKLANRKIQITVDLRLERVRMGNLGLCKSLKNGIYELKIDIGPGYRIYFGKVGNNIILLLCAGDKRSQKNDIEKAKKYFQDFKNQGK